jgi:hypothetical protein
VAEVSATIVHSCKVAVLASGKAAVAQLAASSHLHHLALPTRFKFESQEQLAARLELLAMLLDYPDVLMDAVSAGCSKGLEGYLVQVGVLQVIGQARAFFPKEWTAKASNPRRTISNQLFAPPLFDTLCLCRLCP